MAPGISERRHPKEPARAGIDVASLVEAAADSRQLMRSVLEQLRSWAGCEAAGIRLHERMDYPYFEVQGFPARFLETENHLCALDQEGAPVRDADGNPVLECMCGNVLKGCFDPTLPFFTARGSFWTGSTTDLLASTTEADRQTRTRNRCHGEGYESVALIPLRSGKETLGLLQLNDKERGRFAPKTIALLEQMADTVAGALAERRAKEALLESEERYRTLFETMLEGFAYCQMLSDENGRPVDWIYLAVNSAFGALTGLTDIVGKRVTEAIPGIKDASPELFDTYGRVASTGNPERFEINFTPLSKWLDIAVSSPAKGYFVAVFEDITERKQMDEQLARSEERFRALVENSSDLVAVIDGAGVFEFQSPSCDPILGYRPEELVGRSAFDFIHPDDVGPVRGSFAELAQGRRDPSQSTELRFRHKGGSWRVLEVKARSLLDPAGKVSHVLNSRDTTERRQMEESLHLTQFSVERAADLIHWMDPEGRILFANEASCRRDGYSREEMLSMSIFDLDPTLTPELWRERWQGLKEAGSLTVQSVHKTKGGELYPVEVSANYMEQSGKEYDFVFARDITEHKNAEEALTESEERYRVLVDATSDLIYSYDTALRLTGINRAAARQLGLEPNEALGKALEELGFPESTLAQWKRMTQEVLDSRDSVREVVEAVMPDGESHAYETVLQPVFDGTGEVTGLRGGSRDITEHKRMEQSLKLTQFSVDRAADMVSWMSPDGRFAYANDTICRRLGYTREELLALTIRDVDPQAPEPWEEHWQNLKRRGSLTFETVHRTKSGEIFPVEVTANYVEYEGQEYNLPFARDISERKRVEEALRVSEEQLRQSQKMEAVGQLAGGIAHDFNNVLTTIIGYSDLILASAECAEGSLRGDVEEIKAAGERASALTRQILAFSRRQALQPEVLCLNDVLESTERLLRRTLGEDIDFITLLRPDLGLVEVDAHQFGQVLVNLALNARDAMPSGGKLTLETTNVELGQDYCRAHPGTTPGAYVMLAVSDNGVGMNEETKSHVFEPFFTTKEPGKGTGLGLATVYGVVKQSGGSIFVYSEPGKGSTFKVYLPRVDKPAKRRAGAARLPGSAAGSETILVVEDETAVRELVRRVLERLGYAVLTVGSGDEALTLLEEADFQVDLLLTDVVLPGSLQGNELARAAGVLWPRLPVLYMSGYTRNAIVHSGQLDEGVNYMEKPFTPDKLARRVRDVLDSQPASG